MANIERIGMSYYASNIDRIDKPIKIPSQMFPLNGEPFMFQIANTEDCDDEDVLRAYNAVTPDIGRCYTNTRRLLTSLAEHGVDLKRVLSFVGWVFVGNIEPVHHCFTVIDGKHIFDFIADFKVSDYEAYAAYNEDEMRQVFIDRWLTQRDQLNTERFGGGKVDRLYCYIACPCIPEDGLKIYNKLMKAYPKHPSYSNITPTGGYKLQNMMLEHIASHK